MPTHRGLLLANLPAFVSFVSRARTARCGRRCANHGGLHMAKARCRLAKGVVASALSLLFATAAQSAFYPARFDPGGNGFDIPGFNGNALFDIPDSCIVSDGSAWLPTNINSSSGGCGNASMLTALVFLYTTSPVPPAPGDTPLGQFVLDEGPYPVLGVLSANGVVLGVDTDPMGPEQGTGPYVPPEYTGFWLQFVSGACEFGCTAVPPMLPPPDSEFLSLAKPLGDPAYIFVNSLDNPSFPATVVFGPACADQNNPTLDNCRVALVPEPGTLALLAASLGAGWALRRRKRTG